MKQTGGISRTAIESRKGCEGGASVEGAENVLTERGKKKQNSSIMSLAANRKKKELSLNPGVFPG